MNMSNASQVWDYATYMYSFNESTWNINNSDILSNNEAWGVPRYLTYINLISQIVIGLIGNVISLIVWTKGKECSKLACSTYFQLLAISDMVSLFFVSFQLLVLNYYNTVYTPFEFPALCVVVLLHYFPLQLSNGIVVCISVERFLNLVFPFTFSPRGAKFRAYISFVVLICVMIAVNGFAFTLCLDPRSYIDISVKWSEISGVYVLVVVPITLIVTINLSILISMCCKNRRSNILSRKQHDKRVAVFTKLTLYSSMLLAISLFPSLVFDLNRRYNFFNSDWNQTLSILVSNTLYINNCFNFLVYCFSGQAFRSDVKFLFRRTHTGS